MARTRSPDYDKIHDEIIRKAAAIFANRGYAATSIGDIAQACGCSKSRLYHYFDSKEAILLDMLNTHVDTLLERCRHSLYGFQDPHERFQQLIRFFLEVYAVSRDLPARGHRRAGWQAGAKGRRIAARARVGP